MLLVLVNFNLRFIVIVIEFAEMRLTWVLVLVGAIQLCAGSKILAIVQMPSRSHHNLLERLVIELTKKNHEVTFITPYKQSKPVKNLKEIIIPDLYKNMTGKHGRYFYEFRQQEQFEFLFSFSYDATR